MPLKIGLEVQFIKTEKGWQGFQRIKSCNCLFKITGKTAIYGIKKKENSADAIFKSYQQSGLAYTVHKLLQEIEIRKSVLFTKLINLVKYSQYAAWITTFYQEIGVPFQHYG